MNLKNKRILVTGSNGFIGTNLVKCLRALGANVSTFDISAGQNINNPKQVLHEVKKKYHVIYHLAGISGSIQSNQNKLKCFEINTFSLAQLCQFLVNYSPRTKLILSSSRLEYGVPKYLPVDELHPTLPTSIYGLSKLAATQLAIIYHLKNKLDTTVFRTSNVYGSHPANKFTGYNVVNHFVDLAKSNQTITIYGSGNQKRDYIFIDDLVNAFILALAMNSSGQIYNLGAGYGIKFRDMAKLIIKKVGRGKLKFIPWPKNVKNMETGSYISDISKIKRELNFKPRINFEQGLEKTINP